MIYSNNEEHNDFGFVSPDIGFEDNTPSCTPILSEWIKPFIDNLNKSLEE